MELIFEFLGNPALIFKDVLAVISAVYLAEIGYNIIKGACMSLSKTIDKKTNHKNKKIGF